MSVEKRDGIGRKVWWAAWCAPAGSERQHRVRLGCVLFRGVVGGCGQVASWSVGVEAGGEPDVGLACLAVAARCESAKLAGWEATLWVGSGLPGPARWPGKVVAELRRCRCVRKSCCGVVWVVGCRGDSTGGEDTTEREEHVLSA